ncbi:unnamed protein product, partial [Tetraodon nigroviridis]
ARSGWCGERACRSTATPSTRGTFTSSLTSSSPRTTGSAPRSSCWRTSCPHGQTRPSSPQTRRRWTCRTSTPARAPPANAGRPTTTARTKRAGTTGRGCSVPTSSPPSTGFRSGRRHTLG